MKYYCKNCGQYVEDDYIEKSACPHCGYEEIDGYRIIDGCCGKCGKHLTKTEIKYRRCMECDAQFVEAKKYNPTYTQRKRAIAIFGVVGSIIIILNIKTIITTIMELGALAIFLGIGYGILSILAKLRQMEIRAKYDFYHDAIKDSPYYKEKHDIDD